MRSSSGVTPITLFTKPYPCGGTCIFCPSVPGIPKSYLERVKLSNKSITFKPKSQMDYWLSYLQSRSGVCSKLEVIILGGSFLRFPIQYIKCFIRDIYRCIDGALEPRAKVEHYIKQHEAGTGNRLIGITVEARPDQINSEIVSELFSLGVTKIEIGVPSVNEKVLSINKRGHGVDEVRHATEIIKDHGLKVGYHLLFGLPGSTVDSDIESAAEIVTKSCYLPDHLKLYFCEMFLKQYMSFDIIRLFQDGCWKPYSKIQREAILSSVIPLVPRFVRISRIGRKITRHDLESGVVEAPQYSHARECGCKCIRCREPKDELTVNSESQTSVFEISQRDFFIEEHLANPDICLGILRLRHAQNRVALVREVHVYGSECAVGGKGGVQHKGIGKRLIAAAEKAAKENWGAKNLGIASGVGVRSYYEKCGYRLGRGDLMWKKL